MKKLMFAAVAALSMGAFAENTCAPVDPIIVDPTLVYAVKMNVKTTKGVTVSVTEGDAGTICAPGEITVSAKVIRTKDTTKFAGWIYDCTATCSTIADGSLVLWDSKRKAQIEDAAIATTFINVMAKKQNQAEWAWTLEGTAKYDETRTQAYALTGAGVGKFSTKKGYYTSFSGNFAGTAAASYDLSKKAKVCDPSQIWKCDDLTTLTDSDTVAYGTWTVKYSSSASKKFAKNGYLKVPAYVTIAE